MISKQNVVGGAELGKITCFLTLHNLFLDCVSHFYEKPALLNHLSQNKHQNKKGGCQKPYIERDSHDTASNGEP